MKGSQTHTHTSFMHAKSSFNVLSHFWIILTTLCVTRHVTNIDLIGNSAIWQTSKLTFWFSMSCRKKRNDENSLWGKLFIGIRQKNENSYHVAKKVFVYPYAKWLFTSCGNLKREHKKIIAKIFKQVCIGIIAYILIINCVPSYEKNCKLRL
jgi:hypothetical protein